MALGFVLRGHILPCNKFGREGSRLERAGRRCQKKESGGAAEQAKVGLLLVAGSTLAIVQAARCSRD